MTPVQTGVLFGGGTGFVDFIDGRGGSLQRNFSRGPGFGLFTFQDRNRYEINAHMQNIVAGNHTIKWGFEFKSQRYNIDTRSSGPADYLWLYAGCCECRRHSIAKYQWR